MPGAQVVGEFGVGGAAGAVADDGPDLRWQVGGAAEQESCGAAHGYAVQHDAGVRADGADEPAEPAQVVEVVEPAHADVASAAVAVRAVVRHGDVEPARAVVAGEVAHQRCVGPVPVNEDDRTVSRPGCGKVIAGQPCAVVRGDSPALVRRGSHPCPALAPGRGRGGGDQVAVVGGLVADGRLSDDRRVDQGRREPGRGRGCEACGGSQDAGRPGGHDRAPAGRASTCSS